jgi:putative aminopeptidase FrvX
MAATLREAPDPTVVEISACTVEEGVGSEGAAALAGAYMEAAAVVMDQAGTVGLEGEIRVQVVTGSAGTVETPAVTPIAMEEAGEEVLVSVIWS